MLSRRKGLLGGAVAAAVLSVLPGLGLIGQIPPAGAAGGGWAVPVPAPPHNTNLFSVGCIAGSNANCWVAGGTAVAGTVETTSNGGGTWTDQTASLPASTGKIASIACVLFGGAPFCWGVGAFGGAAFIVETGNGGTTWSAQTVPTVGGSTISNLASISCVAATTDCFAAGTVTGAGPVVIATTNGSTWTVTSGSLAAVNGLAAISCPSATVCYAVGSNAGGATAISTVNAGSAWSPAGSVTVPAGSALSSVSCGTTTACVAVGQTGAAGALVEASTDSGATWFPQTTPAVGVLDAVTCSSSTVCFAAGTGVGGVDALLAVSDGMTWYSETDSGAAAGPLAIGCTGSSVCIAAGATGVVDTPDAGSTAVPNAAGPVSASPGNEEATVAWVPPTQAAGAGPVSGYTITPTPACASCTGLNTGGATDFSVVSGLTNGVAYTFTVTATDGSGAGAASAASAAVTPNPPVLTIAPSWTVQNHAESLAAVTCVPLSTDCWAAGSTDPGSPASTGLVLSSTNSGSTWSAQSLPAVSTALSGIGCANTNICFAAGTSVNTVSGLSSGVLLATANGGGTWTSSAVPAGIGSLRGVACLSTSACTVVGSQLNGSAAILFTANSGSTWSQAQTPSTAAGLASVSCQPGTPSLCVAAGAVLQVTPAVKNATALFSSNSGEQWTLAGTTPLGFSTTSGLTSVVCTNTSDCLAAGPGFSNPPATTDVATSTDGGNTWGVTAVSATVDEPLDAISCGTAANCWAAGSAGGIGAVFASANGGSTWSPQSSPASVTNLSGLACVTSSTCVAVGTSPGGGPVAIGTANGGTTWSVGSTGILPGASAISCGDANDCEGVASPWGVEVTTNGGTSWAVDPVSGVTSLDAISCASASSCLAGGTNGGNGAVVATTNGGASWASDTLPSGVTSVSGLSCPSTSTCFATGAAGASPVLLVTTNGGSSWAKDTVPAGITSLAAVSCPSTSACAAAGAGGGIAVFTTNGGTTWTAGSGLAGSVTALSCYQAGSSVTCAASGNNAGAPVASFSTNGGSSWTAPALPAGFSTASLSSAACSSVGTCLFGGSMSNGNSYGTQGFVLVTTNAGTSWTPETVAGGASGVSSLNCPAPASCFAAYGGIAFSAAAITIPGAPTIGTASVNGSSVTVTWTAPTSNGGSPITGYVITPSPACGSCAGLTASGSATSTIVTGLTIGTGYTFTVAAQNGAGTGPASAASNKVTPTSLVVTTTSLPNGTVGQSYSQTLAASGGTSPYTWTVSAGALPGGLTLSSAGAITGVPSAAGTFNFTAQVTDSSSPVNTATQALSITIPQSTLQITTTSLPTAVTTKAYSATIVATGGTQPYTWQYVTNNLMTGFSFNVTANQFVITGTPKTTGSNQFSVTVSDASNPQLSSSATFTFTVVSNVLIIGTTSLPNGQAGVAYSQPLGGQGGIAPYAWSLTSGTLPSGLVLTSAGVISGTPSIPLTANFTITLTDSESPPASVSTTFTVLIRPSPATHGYWEVAADGGVFSFGSTAFYGSMGGIALNAPVIGGAPTPDGLGYWEVGEDGGVFCFGDAGFFGSMGGAKLNGPIVDIAPTPDGLGYWELGADGGVFTFGDAGFLGSRGGFPYAPLMVAMHSSPDGKGYWLVADNGAVFTFGDAGFFGSMGGQNLQAPVVAFSVTPDGMGYWEAAVDGGVFAFGDAVFAGSLSSSKLTSPAISIAGTLDGQGYLVATADGRVVPFGDAVFSGGMGGIQLAAPIQILFVP